MGGFRQLYVNVTIVNQNDHLFTKIDDNITCQEVKLKKHY